MGLKQVFAGGSRPKHMLSAKPLVGLKQWRGQDVSRGCGTFSRTPRGFEATVLTLSVVTVRSFSRTPRGFEACKKRQLSLGGGTFSRTPRGFEAVVGSWGRAIDDPFSRTPRGFEASLCRTTDV